MRIRFMRLVIQRLGSSMRIFKQRLDHDIYNRASTRRVRPRQ